MHFIVSLACGGPPVDEPREPVDEFGGPGGIGEGFGDGHADVINRGEPNFAGTTVTSPIGVGLT